MQEKSASIPAMSCGHCAMTIRRELGQIEGVESVEAETGTRRVTIRWSEPATWDQIVATLVEIGYPPE